MKLSVAELYAYVPFLLSVIGAMALITSLIVEITKDLGFVKKIPTKLWAIIVSLICCVGAFYVYAAFVGLIVVWHYIFTVVIASFVVSFISTYGWDSFNELVQRYKK